MNIAIQMRAIRQQRGWTLKHLAERCELSLSYLSDIERGRTVPSYKTMERLAEAFDLALELSFVDKDGKLPGLVTLSQQQIQALLDALWVVNDLAIEAQAAIAIGD